jgi:hypothetical protein
MAYGTGLAAWLRLPGRTANADNDDFLGGHLVRLMRASRRRRLQRTSTTSDTRSDLRETYGLRTTCYHRFAGAQSSRYDDCFLTFANRSE